MRRLSASGKDVKVGDEAENKKGEIDRMDNYITGAAIRALRGKNRLTQQQLADCLNISLNFMGKIEVAFSKPSLDTLIDIAQKLEISVSDLTKFD